MLHRSGFGILATVAAIALAASCGGGGGGGGGGANPPPPPPLLQFTTSSPLQDAVVNELYVWDLTTSGGSGVARNFLVTSGALPAGMTLDATNGRLSGTPIGPLGPYSFAVTVSDGATPPQTASRTFQLRVIEHLQMLTTSLPDAQFGIAYSQTIQATGGTPPYAFSIIGPVQLPAGLTLSANGVISGVPTGAAFNRTFSLRVIDSGNSPRSVDRQLSIRLQVEILTTTLPDADGFEFYAHPLIARGGNEGFRRWGLASGSLPWNLQITEASDGTGGIVGVPNGVCNATTTPFEIYASEFPDPVPPNFDRQLFNFTVRPVPMEIWTPVLPAGLVGFPCRSAVRTRGGALAFDFAASGDMPSWLNLDSFRGDVSGTPTVPATHTFDVTVTDGCGAMDTQTYTIAIHAPGNGRNDSIATATPVGNGTYDASLSPSGPSASVFGPDQDYYVITTSGAATVTVRTSGTGVATPVDTVLEFVDANGVRLNTCVPPDFNSPCMNDDADPGFTLFSQLLVRLAGPTTFYVRVLDWRGDARPDMTYRLLVDNAI